jgi:hypothetical protein
MAAIFGVLNYIALQSTMQLVDHNCVLYPRNLSFHMVLRADANVTYPLNDTSMGLEEVHTEAAIETMPNETSAQTAVLDNSTEKIVTKRETSDDNITIEINNVTIVTGKLNILIDFINFISNGILLGVSNLDTSLVL